MEVVQWVILVDHGSKINMGEHISIHCPSKVVHAGCDVRVDIKEYIGGERRKGGRKEERKEGRQEGRDLHLTMSDDDHKDESPRLHECLLWPTKGNYLPNWGN